MIFSKLRLILLRQGGNLVTVHFKRKVQKINHHQGRYRQLVSFVELVSVVMRLRCVMFLSIHLRMWAPKLQLFLFVGGCFCCIIFLLFDFCTIFVWFVSRCVMLLRSLCFLLMCCLMTHWFVRGQVNIRESDIVIYPIYDPFVFCFILFPEKHC